MTADDPARPCRFPRRDGCPGSPSKNLAAGRGAHTALASTVAATIDRVRPFVLLGLPALLLGGCIVPVEFDPVGEVASVQGEWTIGGAAPTAASCGEIAYVRIRFFEGEDHRDHPALVFDCADGSFDTRPRRVVAQGAWTLAPVAIRADGSVVEEGPREVADTGSGAHLVISPFAIAGAP